MTMTFNEQTTKVTRSRPGFAMVGAIILAAIGGIAMTRFAELAVDSQQRATSKRTSNIATFYARELTEIGAYIVKSNRGVPEEIPTLDAIWLSQTTVLTDDNVSNASLINSCLNRYGDWDATNLELTPDSEEIAQKSAKFSASNWRLIPRLNHGAVLIGEMQDESGSAAAVTAARKAFIIIGCGAAGSNTASASAVLLDLRGQLLITEFREV